MKSITKRVLASILTFTIAFAQLSTLGMYGIAYATEIRDTSTSNSNVEFDVYFGAVGYCGRKCFYNAVSVEILNRRVG